MVYFGVYYTPLYTIDIVLKIARAFVTPVRGSMETCRDCDGRIKVRDLYGGRNVIGRLPAVFCQPPRVRR